MSLTIGILAIGSLYWDKGVREGWRNSRLRMDHERTVMVPIRYGRLSKSGDGPIQMRAFQAIGVVWQSCGIPIAHYPRDWLKAGEHM